MRLPGKVTTKNIKNKSKKQMQLQIKFKEAIKLLKGINSFRIRNLFTLFLINIIYEKNCFTNYIVLY